MGRGERELKGKESERRLSASVMNRSRVERGMKGQELMNEVVMEWECCK